MRAVVVARPPSAKASGHSPAREVSLRDDIPCPRGGEGFPDGRWVRFRPLLVGLDGTDREIIEGKYGNAPEGDDYLIIGHECLGEVLEVGPEVVSLRVGDRVVPTVRRPGPTAYDAAGYQDLTTHDVYYERGINFRHGYLCEEVVDHEEYLVAVPPSVEPGVGVLLEPLSVVEKAWRVAAAIQRARLPFWTPKHALVLGTGTLGLLATLVFRLRELEVTAVDLASLTSLKANLVRQLGADYCPADARGERAAAGYGADAAPGAHPDYDVVFENTGNSGVAVSALRYVAKNGIVVWVSITGGQVSHTVPADEINQTFVLGNKALVGIVNAHRQDFEIGVKDFLATQDRFPGWLPQLLTNPIEGIERWQCAVDQLFDDRTAIKVYLKH